MIGVPAYIAARFIHRFFGFFNHWYVQGTALFLHRTVRALEELERTFAVRVTLRHLFEPLYQDRTVLGYILGFIFRVLRISLGLVVSILLLALSAGLYLVWIFVPVFLFYKIIEGVL